MRLLTFFFLLFLVSCAYTVHNHGTPDTSVELWHKVKVGDDKEKVVNTLGSPTLISKFDENIWYYISYKIKQSNLLGKRKYNSKSLQISFDKNNKVKNIKELEVADRSLVIT